MFNKNNGSNEQDILQNQFTAYIQKSVHRQRIRYLINRNKRILMEAELPETRNYLFNDADYIHRLIDFELLHESLRSIKEKERTIVLLRIVEDKSFSEIASELGMTYKAVTCLYYRVLKKLRKHMSGGENK